MVDDDEWAWIEEQATGDFDHLLLASPLLFALAPAIHHLEEWNEADRRGLGPADAPGGEDPGDRPEHWAVQRPSTGWRR